VRAGATGATTSAACIAFHMTSGLPDGVLATLRHAEIVKVSHTLAIRRSGGDLLTITVFRSIPSVSVQPFLSRQLLQ
jgi:hypothetical protein